MRTTMIRYDNLPHNKQQSTVILQNADGQNEQLHYIWLYINVELHIGITNTN